ncbi:MAG: response regulator [Phycisphaerales bacterium]|nr:response regulator [Phycisphaerales bacterium]
MYETNEPFRQPILLVEDSHEDCEAILRALRKTGVANAVNHCADGDEALDYLYRRGKHGDAPRPGVILLDLNLPGTDGRQVLATIKRDAQLKRIPVIVLTTSTDERDVEGCYRDGANSYIRKPVDLAGFMTAVQRLKDYWFEIVILPRCAAPAS